MRANMSTETKEEPPPLGGDLPLSPPQTEDSLSTSSGGSISSSVSRTLSASSISSVARSTSFPLPATRTLPDVLDQDKKTPDHHVPRDPRLVRLTGVHPFNVEAPLTDLFNEGFLTSPELFYVRNHGAVPEVQDTEIPDWEFTVEGLVQNPMTITLRELMSEYENVTYPITLVCAGNRRKEQNLVKKTKGFSWGPAGVSTALFTGVVLSDVIRKARPKRKARYLCMEGADQLPNGCYGTSIKLNWVMDPNRGIMLAHGMNGEMLTPDHGKPLRVAIPGQIGGRSVKWLKRLIITEEPSDNWYHIYDNRVLPTQVTPEESANDPSWWTDERYAIYDLNNNSAIAYPAHDEKLTLPEAAEVYKLRGYAYAGGGRRISRVEISLDRAKSWRIAQIDYPEDRYREAHEDTELFGTRLDMAWRETSFCWCFWDLDVSIEELKEAKDILVRSMDEAMAIQPRDMYWSVMGMMNNPWYRVVIHLEDDILRFEHPCQPALHPGGWMERVKNAGGNITNGFWGENIGNEDLEAPPVEEAPEVKITKDGVDKKITLDELKEHENEEEPWFVLNGEVFDGTGFLKEHPGGAQSITAVAGTDATEEFLAIHSENAKAMMPDYHIGTLDDDAKAELGAGGEAEEESDGTREIFLQPKKWNKAVLHKKTAVSWDTRVFTFKLDHEEQGLGLPTGMHLMIRLRDPATREAILRPYTPVSHESKKGYLDVLIKVYFDNKERNGGKMSQAIDAIPVGHAVDFKGPVGKFKYLGKGKCLVHGEERKVDRFIMVCGGSGVTPIYQILRAVMMDKQDLTKCTVLDGNRLVEDILCREDLDRYAAENEDRCTLIHTLTQAPDDWPGLKGRIAAPLLKEHCPVGERQMALICGPAPLEDAVHTALLEQGWNEDDLLFF